MPDPTLVEHVGLLFPGHDLDPVEVLAAARTWLADNTALSPRARWVCVPPNAMPGEALWGTYVVDNKALKDHGTTVDGFVGEAHDGALPVTVVSLPDAVTVGAGPPDEPVLATAAGLAAIKALKALNDKTLAEVLADPQVAARIESVEAAAALPADPTPEVGG